MSKFNGTRAVNLMDSPDIPHITLKELDLPTTILGDIVANILIRGVLALEGLVEQHRSRRRNLT